MSTSVWWKVLDEGLLRKNQKGDQVEWNLVLIPSPHRGGVPNPSPAGGLLELSGFLVEGMSSSNLGRKVLQHLGIPAEPVGPPNAKGAEGEDPAGVKRELAL